MSLHQTLSRHITSFDEPVAKTLAASLNFNWLQYNKI